MKHDPVRPAPRIPLVDNSFSPELFASGVSGCVRVHDTISITLENARCDHSRPEPHLERIVVGRIVLTVPAAQALVLGLNDFLTRHGLSPSDRAMAGATRQ